MGGRIGLAATLALSVLMTAATGAAAAEHLVMGPYPAETPWKTATLVDKGGKHLREQIPADQNIDHYRDILTDQVFPEAKAQAPEAFLKDMFVRVQGVCDGVRVNGPRASTGAGYPAAYAQIYCGRQKGRDFGVNMFFKVIQGDDALYVIQREFRVPPSAQGGVQSFDQSQVDAMRALMAGQMAASHYLVEQVYLCGPRAQDERCR
jgi:hypothetical protein